VDVEDAKLVSDGLVSVLVSIRLEVVAFPGGP
jgi:hypothetical protein